MIKFQNGKFYKQHEMLNIANCNMIDYFEQYIRNISKQKSTEINNSSFGKVLTDTTNQKIFESIIELEKKDGSKRREDNSLKIQEKDSAKRIIQSKTVMANSKRSNRITHNILFNKFQKDIYINQMENPVETDNDQKELCERMRGCITFIPQTGISHEEKPNLHTKSNNRNIESQRGRMLQLPQILSNNINVERRVSSKSTSQKPLIKKTEEKQNEFYNGMRKFTYQNIEDLDLIKKNYTDIENIQLDSINIMNGKNFKCVDFSEMKKQGIIQQAERQKLKEVKKLTNQYKGFERLNFICKRQKSQNTPKYPFVGLVFQDHENYTPIHSNCSKRTPITYEEQIKQNDINNSLINSSFCYGNRSQKSKLKRNNNNSFF